MQDLSLFDMHREYMKELFKEADRRQSRQALTIREQSATARLITNVGKQMVKAGEYLQEVSETSPDAGIRKQTG